MKESAYIGHLSQLFHIKEYTYRSGRADGLRAVDIGTGAGLQFTVAADRCMDFTHMSFRGENISFISPAGVVAPQYYSDKGLDFLRSFTAGFLTTCGIESSGSPCADEGKDYPLHGRIGNTPAEYFSVDVSPGDVPSLRMKGQMQEARLFDKQLRLTREISCKYGENAFDFTDTVENYGFSRSSYMMLYHFNLGYPLLCEGAEMLLPTKDAEPRDAHAADGFENWMRIDPPAAGYQEKCYFLRMKSDENRRTLAGLYNPARRFGVLIRYDAAELDGLTVWKQLGAGEYALGIEPCNAYPDGRKAARENGVLKYLEPGEKRVLRFRIEIIENDAQADAVRREIAAL